MLSVSKRFKCFLSLFVSISILLAIRSDFFRHPNSFRSVGQYINYTSNGRIVSNRIRFNYPIQSNRCADVQSGWIAVIVSAPSNRRKRDRIRQTWTVPTNPSGGLPIHYVFLIGKELENNPSIVEESLLYQDVVQVDLDDTYLNLTIKSVALLDWIHRFCPGADFVLKCDDDVYVNVNNLDSLVRNEKLIKNHQKKSRRIIYGLASVNLKPIRSPPEHRWSVDEVTWPWSSYPPYITGGAYLIAAQAVGPLLAAARVTPIFQFEDIYVTGLCARKAANIQLRSSNVMSDMIGDVMADLFAEDAWLVYNSVTWMTDFDEQMIASHLAVEFHAKNNRTSYLSPIEWTIVH